MVARGVEMEFSLEGIGLFSHGIFFVYASLVFVGVVLCFLWILCLFGTAGNLSVFCCVGGY